MNDRDNALRTISNVRALFRVAIAAFDAAAAMRSITGAEETSEMRNMRNLYITGLSITDGAESISTDDLLSTIASLDRLIGHMEELAEQNARMNQATTKPN